MAVMLIPCVAGDIMQSALWKITECILLFYEKGSGLLLELPGQGGFREDHGSGRLPVIMGFFYFICGEKGRKRKRADKPGNRW